MDQIRISAKHLGSLTLPDFCERCFWLNLKMKFRLPFQIFPGIFSSIDSYSKKITNVCFDKHGHVPHWFNEFGDLGKPITVPHHSRFFHIDHETNIRLTGVCDDILKRNDGSYFIIDYKTARYTNGQDALLPIYEAQLNGYAYIAERTGIGPVSGLGLIYYEPQTDLSVDGIEDVLLSDGFLMGFNAKLVNVRCEPEAIVAPLLKKVREIADLETVPNGTERCKDCEKLEEMVSIIQAETVTPGNSQ